MARMPGVQGGGRMGKRKRRDLWEEYRKEQKRLYGVDLISSKEIESAIKRYKKIKKLEGELAELKVGVLENA